MKSAPVVGVFACTLLTPVAAEAGILDFAKLILAPRASAQNTTPPVGPNSQTIPLLKAATNLDPNPSKGGGDITVVDDTALLADAGPSGTLADIESHTGTAISLYVVREGDNLGTVARMFGVSVNTIMWANNIQRASLIKPGQTLVILPISGVRHTVAKGDTIASIAKKYKGDAAEIRSYNGLAESATLAVGDIVIIPDGEIVAPPVSARVIAGGGPNYSGYYIRPTSGTRTQGIHGYNGIDIGAPVGTPIIASAAGTVIIARSGGWNGGYGTYIVISHDNGTQTLYAHNSSNAVSVGQYVSQGQTIGYVGSTGKSTGPHLHFEVRGAKNPF